MIPYPMFLPIFLYHSFSSVPANIPSSFLILCSCQYFYHHFFFSVPANIPFSMFLPIFLSSFLFLCSYQYSFIIPFPMFLPIFLIISFPLFLPIFLYHFLPYVPANIPLSFLFLCSCQYSFNIPFFMFLPIFLSSFLFLCSYQYSLITPSPMSNHSPFQLFPEQSASYSHESSGVREGVEKCKGCRRTNLITSFNARLSRSTIPKTRLFYVRKRAIFQQGGIITKRNVSNKSRIKQTVAYD